jgi:hypothetical protein
MKPNREPNPEWDPVFKSNYRAKLLSRADWIRKGQALLESAKLLEPDVAAIWKGLREWHERKHTKELKSDEILSVYLMLVAFTVENLLKARLIQKCYHKFRDEFESYGRLPPLLKTHDLFPLAKEAGLSIGTEEEDLLRRLTRAAIWAGRYPLPIEFGDLAGSEEFSDGKTWSVSYFGGNDIDRLKKLIDKIRTEFDF